MTVRQMAALVHPPAAVRRLMFVLKAFFDESGLHSTNAFAMAGYLAPEKEWEKLEGRWRALLKRPLHFENPKLTQKRAAIVGRPLEFLHSTEMEGLGKGRFRALGQRNRDRLINESVTTIVESGIVGIASAIILPEYYRLDETTRKAMGDPYMLCFQHVITQVTKAAQMFIGEDHSEDIAYIFEQQPQWQMEANRMWVRSLELGYKKKYRLGSITFGDKAQFIPLQAADRNAFETFQHFDNPNRRAIWNRLKDSDHHRGCYFDREGLQDFIVQLKKSGRL